MKTLVLTPEGWTSIDAVAEFDPSAHALLVYQQDVCPIFHTQVTTSKTVMYKPASNQVVFAVNDGDEAVASVCQLKIFKQGIECDDTEYMVAVGFNVLKNQIIFL